MKYVSTSRGYQSLTAEVDGKPLTVTGVPQQVANAAADELVKVGADHGIRVNVVDEADYDPDAVTTQDAVAASRAPDLSAGIAVVTGRGAPVLTTPTGDVDSDDDDTDTA